MQPSITDPVMKDLLILFVHLLIKIARLLGPGGARAVVADSLLMKQQLLVINRSRRRAPNLSTLDRFLFGFWSLFLNSHRILQVAVIIQPSTLLQFHNLLMKRKYRLLYSSDRNHKSGPKEIKSIPYTPTSHPFIERLIGTIRREYLDRVFFWNGWDLERKLEAFRQYYNKNQAHQSLSGDIPSVVSGNSRTQCADLSDYSWISHCNDLFQTPIAA